MNARAAFDTALEAARQWHASLPEVTTFCNWPDDLTYAPRAAQSVPATALVLSDPGQASAASTPLMTALQGIAHHVEWRLTYSADQVGQQMLDNYGWFELAGPEGHFTSRKARITVGYWGPGLFYPRHQHAPEELYTVVSGQGIFHVDGEPDITLGPGGTRFHGPNQPHALTTSNSAILTLVFWRGETLDSPLEIST